MVDVDAIHDGDREATLRAIGEQGTELHGVEMVPVTCPCGTTGPVRRYYRCFYCDVFFCPDCAETHFEEVN